MTENRLLWCNGALVQILPRPLPLLLLAFVASPSIAPPVNAEPEVPGFVVEVYATVDGPVGLSFDAAGNLFVGRDDIGADPLEISRIPPGGDAAAFGPEPLPDPAGVLVDLDGSIGGAAGAVVISGEATPGDGQIVAIIPNALPDASLVTLHAASAVLSNPDALARGRDGLLVLDSGRNAIFSFVPPGPPVVLIDSPSRPSFLAVDAQDRIYVSHADGVVRQYDADGALLNGSLLSGVGEGSPLAVSPGGPFGSDLYVLSHASGELLRVAGDGSASVAGSGFPETALGEIEFGPDGALYVASFAGDEVLRIAPAPPPPDLDAFLCYGTRNARGEERFEPRSAELSDAFESGTVRVAKPKELCAPAATSDGSTAPPPVGDPAVFLARYRLARAGAPPHLPQRIGIANRLASFDLDTLPRGDDGLLVPSSFGLSAAPPALGATAVDAFRCYPARLPPGERFARPKLAVAESGRPARLFQLRAPKRLCLPVELDGAPIQRPDDLLVCYPAKPAKGQASPDLTGVHVTNAFGPDQRLDTVNGRTPTRSSTQRGRIMGDENETFSAEGTTRPGEWTELDGEPVWTGGGPLGEGEGLRSSFTDSGDLPEGEVQRWRVFVEIDLFVNDTGKGPGVVMRSFGIPGIPEGSELRAMSSGKPRGLRVSGPFFTPPAGTTLASLAGAASQEFEPNGDSSSQAFAFQLVRWGIEYELVSRSGGRGTGVPERELCLPSELAG